MTTESVDLKKVKKFKHFFSKFLLATQFHSFSVSFVLFVVAQHQQKILLVKSLKKLIYESRQNVVTQNVVSCYCWGKAAYPGTTRNQIEDKLHLNHDVKVLCLYFLVERF